MLMNVNDILAPTGGLAAMARELGVGETQAASGAAALLPAMLGGFKKQATKSPTGPKGLGGLLGGVLGGAGSRAATQGGGASGLAPMLNLDGDGNPLDDVLRMVGQLERRSPALLATAGGLSRPRVENRRELHCG